MEKNTSQIRDEILLALLPEVPFDGWQWQGVSAAAMRAGYNAHMAAAVFPGKLGDVLAHFADWADRHMLLRLEGIDPGALRVRDLVGTAVMTRIKILQEHREAEKLALAYWSVPSHSLRAGRIVWRTADRIWDWAGDTATDYNRYTKRGLLCGVLSATMLAWAGDETADLAETEAFLGRRIENVMQFGRILGKIKKAS